jgi:putative transposase
LVKKDLEQLVNDSYFEVIAEKYGFKNVAELKKLKHQALMKTVPKTTKTRKVSMAELCSCFGLTRDAYYKFLNRRRKQETIASKVIKSVKEERKDKPRMGTRKLYIALYSLFMQKNLKVGRDKLFDIFREHEMLVKRKKASSKDTDSYHRFHSYKNLVKDMVVTASNQVWVSDITYIRTICGFCYLALISDMYSRKIVGDDISDSLELAGCMRALKMALAKARPAVGLVYHSDRGIQSCSNQYAHELKKRNIKISMTE